MSLISYLRRIAPCSALLASIAATGVLNAQSLGSVSGKVSTATGAPVVGAFISLDDAPPITQTDETGSFRIDGIAAGGHVLHVRRGGFVEAIDSVVVAGDADQPLAITLAEKIATLAGVTVIGTKSDMAERREQLEQVPGGVAMVEATQLRATRQANLKDALQFDREATNKRRAMPRRPSAPGGRR